MDYLPSVSAITRGIIFAAPVLFAYLRTRTAPFTLFNPGVPDTPEPEPPNEPHTEVNPLRRDQDYYFQATTIVFRVCFFTLRPIMVHLYASFLDSGYSLSRARRLLVL